MEVLPFEGLDVAKMQECFRQDGEFAIDVRNPSRFFLLHMLRRIENEQIQWEDTSVGLMMLNLLFGLPISLAGVLFFPKLREVLKLRYLTGRHLDFSILRQGHIRLSTKPT